MEFLFLVDHVERFVRLSIRQVPRGISLGRGFVHPLGQKPGIQARERQFLALLIESAPQSSLVLVKMRLWKRAVMLGLVQKLVDGVDINISGLG